MIRHLSDSPNTQLSIITLVDVLYRLSLAEPSQETARDPDRRDLPSVDSKS